ncbi:MAG TPA: choice-of-anchor J domain-containing protein [Chryseosolibacter sp.]
MACRALILFFGVLTAAFSAFAQDRCGTVEYHKTLKTAGRIPANDNLFENWLKNKMTALRAASAKRQKGPPYKIPVVVHIIHNGEPIGSGTNISDEQVLSQIEVLNEDFRRLNSDASQTPSQFTSVAGSMDIEFVLAKRDPEGLATNGIVRVQGAKTGWTLVDNYELKAQSYWPAEDYLNLWVCDLVDNLVGYGQYPESNLPGIDQSSVNRLTDGVVIWYRAFGSADDGNFNLSSTYNKGRTLTHELGHFFGLRHIWGDDSGSCDGDDFVNDTPKQATSSSGCPTHPRSSCGTVNMFQNYMDYTADACMNLFTNDQVARMTIVLENSPRRVSLLTSPGLSEPLSLATDLGLKTILSPAESHCSTTITPSIEIRNYGSNAITTAKIQLVVNGTPGETRTLSLNLTTLQSTQVDFSPIAVTAGSSVIEFRILETNGTTDQNAANNVIQNTFTVPDSEATPFNENFNTFPAKWTIRNPDGKKTWELATAPRETSTNKAMRVNFFDYDESYGEVDMLISPRFDLTSAPVASLVFDVAYTRYLSSNDRLKVVMITECQSIEDGTVIFEKIGSNLRTTNSTSGTFVPVGTEDWRREFINISGFIGQSNVQLAFLAVSDWGNNLYLDNVSILTSALEDVELQGIDAPAFITCNPNPSPVLQIQNVGTKIINSLTVQYAVNGSGSQFTVNNLNVALGDQFQIALPAINLIEGTNSLAVTLLNPNGQPDQSPTNNSKTFPILLDATTERIPARQNFDGGFRSWQTFNASGGESWEETNTNFNGSAYYNAHNNTAVNETAWLVSPVLDFSSASEASLVFDYSYRKRPGRSEALRVYGSKDCGETFEEISLLSLPAEELQSAWAPTASDDWVTDFVINLNAYAGEPDVRIAFAVINDHGNNLFLDNVEFFTAANPVLVSAETPYNLYGYNLNSLPNSELQLTFNLDQLSEVEYTIVDMMGNVLAQAHLYDVLNQTYKVDATDQLSSGTYLLRLQIGRQHFANRFLIVR